MSESNYATLCAALKKVRYVHVELDGLGDYAFVFSRPRRTAEGDFIHVARTKEGTSTDGADWVTMHCKLVESILNDSDSPAEDLAMLLGSVEA